MRGGTHTSTATLAQAAPQDTLELYEQGGKRSSSARSSKLHQQVDPLETLFVCMLSDHSTPPLQVNTLLEQRRDTAADEADVLRDANNYIRLVQPRCVPIWP